VRFLAWACRSQVVSGFPVRTLIAPDELREKPKTLALCRSNSPRSRFGNYEGRCFRGKGRMASQKELANF